MGEVQDSMYISNLRPVLTIISGGRIIDSICKLIVTNSLDQRMDFESLEFTHNFETRGDSKLFDKYVAQGIMKLSWTTKCRKFVPASILLVFDWCGAGIDSPILESPDWRHKEQTILKFLRKFKDQCKGRMVKIGILCLLGSTNEEISIDEKLSSLKKTGEVDGKGVVLLRHKLEESEQLAKLKKYLWDGCINHYKDEIDRLKKLKSRAHKELSGNFIELQIRYNFKLGYYSELRQDKEAALNFYKKSYKELQDASIDSSTQLEERRSVADLVFHRIVCILLGPAHLLGKLKEAVSIFKTHITSYRLPKHKSFCTFEAWKWLSEHFSRFGGLLEKVPPEIYESDNFWTHPGFYHKVAGVYYVVRMKLSIEDPEFLQSVQNWQGFIASAGLRIKDPVYLGQSKALASHPLQKDMIEGISTADQAKIIKILEESEVKHLQLALEYLFRSLKFYKGPIKMNRISLEISYMLSDLYKKKGEEEASYQYKCEVMQKMEGWGSVQGLVLEDLVSSSIASNKTIDILQWALKSLEIRDKDKDLMFGTLNSVLSSNLVQVKYKGLLSAKARFEHKSVTVYSSIRLFLSLCSALPCALSPIKLTLIFSDSSFNYEIPEIQCLPPNQPVEITHTLVIRNPSLVSLHLLKVLARFEPVGMSWVDFELDAKAKILINSPPPQLSPTFTHLPPALIGENYQLIINLHPYSMISAVKMIIYEEEKEIGMRRRTASIDRDFDSNYRIFEPEGPNLEDGVNIAELNVPVSIPLMFLFFEEKNYNLKAKFSYSVHKPHDIVFKCEDVYDLDITVQPPFQFKMKWLNGIEVNSQGVLNVKMWNACPTPICIRKISVIPEADWVCEEVKVYESLLIQEGSVISEDFIVRSTSSAASNLFGSLLVTWGREQGVVNDCRIPIPAISSQYFPIDLEISVGAEANLGQVFEVTAKIRNKTRGDIEARLILEESNSFLVGGVENVKIILRADNVQEYRFSLVGVENGLLVLPRVTVKLADTQRHWQGKILVLP